jgi:hypothetical protein
MVGATWRIIRRLPVRDMNHVVPYRYEYRSLGISNGHYLAAQKQQSTESYECENAGFPNPPPLRVAPLWLGWLMSIVGIMGGGIGLARVLDRGRWFDWLFLCVGLPLDLVGLGIVVMGRPWP